ncbi:MAG: Lrp/AsnC family transcriptional regulator [Gammaproteobacteria bacterium]|nr:Lrp/AsnC family transcriptional regulator [Gammaproteobacteria bacterium]
MTQLNIDSTDRKILSALQKDARLSNYELAEQLSLAPSTCLRRTKQLFDSGIIQGFHAQLDRDKLGLNGVAFVNIRLEKQNEKAFREFELAAAAIPAVQDVYLVSGEYDYVIRVIYRDAKDFELLYTRSILSLPGIASTNTRLVLREVYHSREISLQS